MRTLVGNWVHSFPDDAYPGPNLDWLHEMVRFFDRYLKGVDNGWEHEPALVWFEREYAEPEPFPAAWPGRWRAAAAFPVPGTRARELPLGPGTLGRRRPTPTGVDRAPPPRHRRDLGRPCPGAPAGHPNGLARDLRPDELRGADLHARRRSRSGSSSSGSPEAVLHLTASMPVATCVVRLSEVSPDGRVVAGRHRASST